MYIKFFYQTLYQKLSESFHKNWLRFFLRKIKLYLRKIRLILSSLTVNLYGQVKFVPMLSNKVWTPGGSCRIHTGLLFPVSHSSLILMSTLFIIYYYQNQLRGGVPHKTHLRKGFITILITQISNLSVRTVQSDLGCEIQMLNMLFRSKEWGFIPTGSLDGQIKYFG